MNKPVERHGRPGFLSRFVFGVVLPIGGLLVAAAVWYRLKIHPLPPATYVPARPTLPGIRFWSQADIALQLLLVFPTSLGLCFRLILRTRRQTRLRVFARGVVAVGLGTGIGVAMFQIFVWTLNMKT